VGCQSVLPFIFFIPLLFPQHLPVPPDSLSQTGVRIGAEILLEKNLDLLTGKRVGIICNHTSVLPNKKHLVDTLLASGINVTALFSPEHGIRGLAPAGMRVEDMNDETTGLKVYSLYGKRIKPTAEMMEKIDAIVFDLQDVGARFYTYYITMSLMMEAAANHGKTFIVLDRPNPINGIDVEGPILDSTLQSGVGRFPLPIRHGLTLGEIARMIVGEEWLGGEPNLTLAVIPMEGWHREMWFDQTKLPWIPPSPNMKFLSTAIVYPGTCLFEGTNLSEGRGTLKPFEYIGAPWLKSDRLAKKLNALNLPGVRFHSIVFTPQQDSVRAPNPKYRNERCNGIFIQIKDRTIFKPVTTSLKIIELVHSLHPSQFTIDGGVFNRLLGTAHFRTHSSNAQNDSLITALTNKLNDFLKIRVNYLLY
jgi:uncharacterized protein YbbC (DUF1343 family)